MLNCLYSSLLLISAYLLQIFWTGKVCRHMDHNENSDSWSKKIACGCKLILETNTLAYCSYPFHLYETAGVCRHMDHKEKSDNWSEKIACGCKLILATKTLAYYSYPFHLFEQMRSADILITMSIVTANSKRLDVDAN
jgi:hypothetical protein